MEITTTRRAMMGALAIAPLAVSASASAAPQSHRAAAGAIAAAIAHYHQAEAALQTFDRDVHTPAVEGYLRARDAIPHVRIKKPTLGTQEDWWSTDDSGDIRIAREEIRRRGTTDPFDVAIVAGCRELISAADVREAENQRLYAAYAVEEHGLRLDALAEASCEALDALEAARPATIAEFAEKLAVLHSAQRLDLEDAQAAIVADARRLAAH